MNKKQIIRTVAFLLLVGVLLYFLCDLFEYGNNYITKRYKTYKSFEENTVDGVFIGTSGVDRYWIAPQAYEEYGMTVYPFSVDALPSWLVIDMIKEARKYQNPQLIMIDIRPFASPVSPDKTLTENRAKRVIDMLDFFSPLRIDAIKRTDEVMTEKYSDYDTDIITYYLTFINSHNKWDSEDFTFDDIGSTKSTHLGMYFVKKFISKKKLEPFKAYTGTKELDPINEKYLNELLDYIEAEGLNVLFIDTPHNMKEEVAMQSNRVCEILNDRGIACINYNTAEGLAACDFDYKNDFYEGSHTNFYGATKFTNVLSKYISENYQLPDRRGDEACEEWNGVYERTLKTIKKWEKAKAKK